MAKPIKETPILCDEDATRFSKKIKENESKRVSRAEYNRVIENYNKVKKQAKF